MKATVCNCEKLCIRANPSKDSDIITIIDVGTVLECEQSESTDWHSITKINEIPAIGYCMSKYLKVEKTYKSSDRKEVKHG